MDTILHVADIARDPTEVYAAVTTEAGSLRGGPRRWTRTKPSGARFG